MKRWSILCVAAAFALMVCVGGTAQATTVSLLLVDTNAQLLNPEHPQAQTLDPPGSSLELTTATDPPETLDQHIAVEKVFVTLDAIYMVWERGPQSPDLITLEELVINDTGIPWTDYHIELGGGAVFGDDQDPALDPEPYDVVVNAANNAVDLFYSPAIDPVESLSFGTINGVPDASDVMIDISAVAVGETFTITQYPTVGVIPEPATLLLLGAPLALIIRRKRRR